MAALGEAAVKILKPLIAEGVVLEAGGQDDAQASERLECGWEGAEPLQIAFNPAYLLDGLAAGKGVVVAGNSLGGWIAAALRIWSCSGNRLPMVRRGCRSSCAVMPTSVPNGRHHALVSPARPIRAMAS